MELKWLLLLFVINLIYIMIGGICFSYLEYDTEQNASCGLDVMEHILHELPGNETCFTYTQVQTAISSAVATICTTQVENTNISHLGSKWSVLNSAFFATTVITTIGYGHMSPVTQGGQLFLIFYAIPGIPLMLVFLAYIGARISNLNQELADRMKCFKNPRLNSLFGTAVFVVLGITLFILVPASVFHHMEDWSFITASYFCVVTLSTVGFGDYVPGSRDIPWYRVLVASWIMVGLAWFAGVVNNMQTKFQRKIGHHKGIISCDLHKKQQVEWTPTCPIESEVHISHVEGAPQSIKQCS